MGGFPSGGSSSGPPSDELGTAISSVIKSAGSGIGRFMADRLTHGAYSERQQRNNEESQAKLLDTYKDRTSKGEALTTEDLRAWTNAGGDPDQITAMNAEAISTNRSKISAGAMLEDMQKRGLIDEKDAAMWGAAIYSNDPTAAALATEHIKGQVSIAGRVLSGQLAAQRQQTGIDAADKRQQTNIDAQDRRENQREGAASARQQFAQGEMDRRSKLAHFAKNQQIQNQINKGQVSVNQALQTVESGGKDKNGKPIEGYDEDTGKAMVESANSTLLGTKGVNVDRYATEGAFRAKIVTPSRTGLAAFDSENTVYGKGITGIADKVLAAEKKQQFKKLWAVAMHEKDPEKSQAAYKQAMTMLPPDVRSQVIEQLNDAQQRINDREESEQSQDAADAAALGAVDAGSNPDADPNDPDGDDNQ